MALSKAAFTVFGIYFVSQAFIQGAIEGEIRDWVGHKDSRIVELYRHLGAEESRRKMQRLDLVRDRETTDGPSPDTKSPVDRSQDRDHDQRTENQN